MAYAEAIIRCLLIAIFGIALISKVRGFTDFVDSVREMRVLPTGLVRSVARVVLLAEGIVCGLLLIPYSWSGLAGFAVAGLLLIAFAVGIAMSLRHGLRTPCRCFGASTAPLGVPHVVRNLLLTGVCAVGIATSMSGPLDLGAGTLLGGLCGLLLGAAVTAVDDLVYLFRPLGNQ